MLGTGTETREVEKQRLKKNRKTTKGKRGHSSFNFFFLKYVQEEK